MIKRVPRSNWGVIKFRAKERDKVSNEIKKQIKLGEEERENNTQDGQE